MPAGAVADHRPRPLTGWIHFTESDALVLAVVAGVGLRGGLSAALPVRGAPAFSLSPVALLVAVLWLVSYGVSAWRTPIPLPPPSTPACSPATKPAQRPAPAQGAAAADPAAACLHAAGRARGASAFSRLTLGMTARPAHRLAGGGVSATPFPA